MIELLPPEIIFIIISYISHKDISSLRHASKKIRNYCDHPIFWKSIYLKPTDNNNSKKNLWKLSEIKKIIDPHTSRIQSIHIWGVRDDIVKYILLSCPNLQHLTLCGWTTLSDHCLQLLPSQSLKIKTLELIGTSQETNFVSVDAYTLSNLLFQSPHMTHLIIGAESQIHADILMNELEKKNQSNTLGLGLESFALASKNTWFNQHILRMVKIYPGIKRIYLMPKLTDGIDMEYPQKDLAHLLSRKLKEKADTISFSTDLERQLSLISTNDMIIYNNLKN